MRQLLRHRDARLYISGQFLSSIGDNSLWLAMGVWVRILTGSNSAAGLVFCAFTAGLLLAPAGGVVADRFSRRSVLVAVNLASAATVCSLLAVSGKHQVWLVYVVMFGNGASSAFITPAQNALVAVMIPDDLLAAANTLLQVGAQGTRVFTPLIGAGLLAWSGPRPVIALDAATFAVAAAATLALRTRETRPDRASGAGGWRAEFAAGLGYIGRTVALRRLMVTFVLSLTVFGFLETISFAVVSQGLHRTAPFLGVLFAIMAAGTVAGAVLIGPVLERTGERGLVAIGLFAMAASCLLLILAQLVVVVVVAAVFGASLICVDVGATTLIQRRTPTELIGRVDSALSLASTIPQVVSIAAGAALITVVSYRLLLVVMAAVIAASAFYLIGERDRQEPAVGANDPEQDRSRVPAK
jgi:MFS family permease